MWKPKFKIGDVVINKTNHEYPANNQYIILDARKKEGEGWQYKISEILNYWIDENTIEIVD
jgi:hypothetical protein